MNYHQILEDIFARFPMYHKQGSSAYKEGLENIEELAQMAGNPQDKLVTIHIAGTNGKGSVAHLLSSYFQELNYKTGLFTSPHLVDFRERIKINGVSISEEEVIHFFKKYQSQIDPIEPSFFEITTVLAFDYFANQKVDIAIIETGLGGRLDATNIIHPILSIITNVGLDHQQLLGNTLPKIAMEKAGIIKPDTPVLIGEPNPKTLPVFQAVATRQNAPLYTTTDNLKVEQVQSMNPSKTAIRVKRYNEIIYPYIEFPLSGNYQLKNINTFIHAVELLNSILKIKEDKLAQAIQNWIENTQLMGRWQQISEKPQIICDVGHNQDAFQLIVPQLNAVEAKTKYAILGFVDDKDLTHIVDVLPHDFQYYLCKAPIDRALDPEKLLTIFQKEGLTCTLYSPSVYETFKYLRSQINPNDFVFISGSFFVVGDFLSHYYS